MTAKLEALNKRRVFAAATALCASALFCAAGFHSAMPAVSSAETAQTDWPVYGGSPDNIHYSSLNQINTSNVAQLVKVWSYDTHEPGGLETSPIIIDGVLYAYTPTQKVIALDAATGKLIWKFASPSGEVPARAERGLAFWQDGHEGKDKRILAGVANYVYAIDATTGKSI